MEKSLNLKHAYNDLSVGEKVTLSFKKVDAGQKEGYFLTIGKELEDSSIDIGIFENVITFNTATFDSVADVLKKFVDSFFASLDTETTVKKVAIGWNDIVTLSETAGDIKANEAGFQKGLKNALSVKLGSGYSFDYRMRNSRLVVQKVEAKEDKE
jgi:hypothetical protein